MSKSLGVYVVVLVTVPDVETGVKIARELVSSRLVACVNIIKDVKSIFLWEGKVDEASEALLVMKTRLDKMDEVVRRVKELHPYQVPEIIALPIVYGLESYLKWIDEVVQH